MLLHLQPALFFVESLIILLPWRSFLISPAAANPVMHRLIRRHVLPSVGHLLMVLHVPGVVRLLPLQGEVVLIAATVVLLILVLGWFFSKLRSGEVLLA